MKRIVFTFVLFMAMTAAHAQGCSVCTKTAGDLDDKSARGMNAGILYLAAFPLTLLGTIGFIWWRNNRSSESEQ